MTALDNLKRLAEKLRSVPWFTERSSGLVGLGKDTPAFIAACSPKAILALIAEVEQRDEKLAQLIAAWRVVSSESVEADAVSDEAWAEMDAAVADLQAEGAAAPQPTPPASSASPDEADSPPPIARDPVQDAPRRFWT